MAASSSSGFNSNSEESLPVDLGPDPKTLCDQDKAITSWVIRDNVDRAIWRDINKHGSFRTFDRVLKIDRQSVREKLVERFKANGFNFERYRGHQKERMKDLAEGLKIFGQAYRKLMSQRNPVIWTTHPGYSSCI